MDIKTAIVPAAGLGTRMGPITRYVPKELLPVNKVPMIHRLVRELHVCGIKKIVLVSSVSKGVLHQAARDIASEYNINLIIVTQHEPKGLMDAINVARNHVEKGERFLVALPDMLVDLDSSVNFLENSKTSCSVMTMPIEPHEIHKFGVRYAKCHDYHRLTKFIQEKPTKLYENQTEHLEGVVGRYILDHRIFDLYDSGLEAEVKGLDLTKILNEQTIEFHTAKRDRIFDCGDYEGYVKANLHYV